MPVFAIDPHRSWSPLAARAADEKDPRTRAMLTLVRDHMEHEIKGDLARLMATLAEHPIYHFRGTPAPGVLDGRATVEAFYRGMFATGGQQFEVVIERIVADPDCVVTEGYVKQAHRGETLLAQRTSLPISVEVGEWYVSCARLVTVWPSDGHGKLLGEDIYFGDPPLTGLKRITLDELPPYYVR